MSKFLNEPAKAVTVALDALLLVTPGLERLSGTNVIVRSDIQSNEVALVCGGGSGHEPAHAGFVGDGLLTAAVCGDVFASPPHAAIIATLQHISAKSPKGILVIVKNYGGDLINFGYAVKWAKAQGIEAEMIVVDDDVTFGIHNDARRGIAGTVAFYKALGAAARVGYNLKELVALGNHLRLNLRSMGCSLSSCSVPGSTCADPIPQGQMEVGLGIHGEKGEIRMEQLPVTDIVEKLLDKIIKGEKTSDRWPNGTHVAMMVNNLGSTTDIEMGVIFHTALAQLREFYGLQVDLVSCGRFMTALEMHGFSITLVHLHPSKSGSDVKTFLENHHPKIAFVEPPMKPKYHEVPKRQAPQTSETADPSGEWLKHIIKAVLLHVKAQAERYNTLDSVVGDGDTGHGVARAATAALDVIDSLPFSTQLSDSVVFLAEVIAEAFAGTSGPLYGAMLMAGAKKLKNNAAENTAEDFVAALTAGTAAVAELGGAAYGDRTMFDVLHDVTSAATSNVGKAPKEIAVSLAEVAKLRSREVAQLTAKKGRARYLAGKEIGNLDPGCELVVDWLNAVAEQL